MLIGLHPPESSGAGISITSTVSSKRNRCSARIIGSKKPEFLVLAPEQKALERLELVVMRPDLRVLCEGLSKANGAVLMGQAGYPGTPFLYVRVPPEFLPFVEIFAF